MALANGLVIFLQEDHELPLVRLTVRIRGGSPEEPAEKVGLVSLYGQTWRTGGTRKRTGDELDDFLEERAARVETAGGIDSTSISFDCLKGNLDEVFAVFQELLREPEFREEKLAIARNQVFTGIARRNDDRAASPRARRASSATAPTRRTRASRRTPRWRPSSATTCSPGTPVTSTPTT